MFFNQKMHGARRRRAEGPRGAHTLSRRGPTLGRAYEGCGHPVWPPDLPFGLYTPSTLKTPRIGSDFQREFRFAAAILKPQIGIRSLCSGTLLGRGIGGDHHCHHHQRLSINHPWCHHPCVSNSPAVGEGMVGIGWDCSCNIHKIVMGILLSVFVSALWHCCDLLSLMFVTLGPSAMISDLNMLLIHEDNYCSWSYLQVLYTYHCPEPMAPKWQ